ncbi:MAG: DUF190 domain-containing protein [Chloroflexota bacterium]
MSNTPDTSTAKGAEAEHERPSAENPPNPAGYGYERMQQLTIYIGETDHYEHGPLYLRILELAKQHNCAGATVLKGLAGYSASSRSIQTSGFADLAPKLPLVVLIVDAAWRLEPILPLLELMVRPNGGLITVQDLEAHRYLHPNMPGGKRQTGSLLGALGRRGMQSAGGAPGGAGAQGDKPPRVKDLMEKHVISVHPATHAEEVVQLLMGKYYKTLPVIDRDNRVVGMITDGDLMEKGRLPYRLSILEALEASGEQGFQEILENLRSSSKFARDLMSSGPLVTTLPETTALEAARLMAEKGLKRIPVGDPLGRLVGIIGRLDILKAASSIFPQAEINGEDLTNEVPHRLVRLRDILDPNVPVVSADAIGREVVEMLITPPCPRRLVVVDNKEHMHVVGIIADRDLVLRAHVQTRPGLLRMLRESIPFRRLTPQQQQESYRMQVRAAADIMSRNVVTALDETPIGEAVRLLVQREIKVLPVVDRSGRLLGVVGRGTVLRALVENYANHEDHVDPVGEVETERASNS